MAQTSPKNNFFTKIPALRFPEFEGVWEFEKLNSISNFLSGFAFKSEFFSDAGMKLITPKNFTKYGRADFTFENTKYTTEEADRKYLCKEEDLLVLLTDLTPTCELLGKPLILSPKDGNVLLNQRIVKIENFEGIVLKPYLLNYLLTSQYHKRIKETATGSTVRHSSNRILGETFIPLTSIPEQQKIASFLTAVDNKIQQLQKKKQLLEQYKKGVMQQIFTQQLRFKDDEGNDYPEWEEKALVEIADIKGGKRLPLGNTLQSENNGYPYITVSDMGNGTVSLKNIRYVPLQVVAAIKNYKITTDDIFVSVAGTLGIVGVVPKELNNANLTENANKLTNLKCNQTYLLHYLKSDLFKKFISSVQTNNAQPKLAIYALSSFRIYVPSLQEQKKIASYLSSIDSKIDILQIQIEQSQNFKKGLLQQMFV